MFIFSIITLLCILCPITLFVGASSTANALEAARFGPLPPIVFAPGGRLHGVERVARESYPSGEDESSCACIALRCGRGEDEFAILAGVNAISPFLHRDEYGIRQRATNVTGNGDDTYIPLVMDHGKNTDYDAPLHPLSVISPHVIVGVGGKGIDSAVLLRRAAEASLAMYKSDNGGIEWFVSHSLEGIGPDSHNIPIGGAARVDARELSKKIADIAQTSTQSLGAKSGRMLSSSLLTIGVNEEIAVNNSNEATSNISIWRVDPTGQFWSIDAGAVGRAAIDIETELLNKVTQWRKQKTQQMSENESQFGTRNLDVKSYLSTLTVEEALEVANDCLVNGIISSIKRGNHKQSLHTNGLLDILLLDAGLRRRLKSAIIRERPLGATRANPSIELVRC